MPPSIVILNEKLPPAKEPIVLFLRSMISLYFSYVTLRCNQEDQIKDEREYEKLSNKKDDHYWILSTKDEEESEFFKKNNIKARKKIKN